MQWPSLCDLPLSRKIHGCRQACSRPIYVLAAGHVTRACTTVLGIDTRVCHIEADACAEDYDMMKSYFRRLYGGGLAAVESGSGI